MIIIDMGSGETCQNDEHIVQRMIDELAAVCTHKDEVVLKWQLFEEMPTLEPLRHEVYAYAVAYAEKKDFKTTASVFDGPSLEYLIKWKPPFIKLACREYLLRYLKTIERHDIKAIVSIASPNRKSYIGKANYLCCVPKYPASPNEYESMFWGNLSVGISDHTSDFRLYTKYQPWIYESHFKLEDSIGADAGPWSKTPAQWREIL